jgi:hypothetical protein
MVAGLSDQDGTAAHNGGDVRVPHGPSATLCNDCQLWRAALSGSFPMAWMDAAQPEHGLQRIVCRRQIRMVGLARAWGN